MSRRWILLLAASIGLNAGLLWVQISGGPFGERRTIAPPFARRGGPPPGLRDRDPEKMARWHVERLAGHLDLSEEQVASIRDALNETLPRLMESRERMVAARESVAELYRSPELDGATFRERVRELRDVQAELDSVTAEVMLREAEILTPEQRERYLEAMPWGLSRPGGPGMRAGPGRPGDHPPRGGPPRRGERGKGI